MGGAKKKPLAQVEKAQIAAAKKEEKQAKEAKRSQLAKRSPVARPSESEALAALEPMKAVTLHSAAKALGVNASLASSILKSMEAKGILKKTGGYSGHYVWMIGETPALKTG